MKKVEAEIRKERFAEVDDALRRLGVPGLTVADERAAGRGAWTYPLENIRHVLLTVVVDDSSVKRVVESISQSASTKSFGDGRISVSKVEGVFDIGTGLADSSELFALAG
jgi:nitrogen regulatory protein P-II 1